MTGVSVSSAPASGMRDFLPVEAALRDWATASLVKTYEKFGFTRIETPIIENINQLRRGDGGENLQLIFEILKRGEKLDKTLAEPVVARDDLADLGLRFDLTVPLVRFYANNQGTLPNPFKAIQIGSVFRAESPQAGRYRQFTQCDIDTFGIKSETAEIELIEATSEALLELGFEQFTVRLNDRRVLATLAEFCGFDPTRQDNLFIQIDKLDKLGVGGVAAELVINGHPREAVDKLTGIFGELGIGTANSITPNQFIPEKCDPAVIERLNIVLSSIKHVASGKYNIVFDPTLVRGMGYYTGQIFEISAAGVSYSIAGGGRYDKMVGKMSGRDVPAVGFSIGFERIISILMDQKLGPTTSAGKIAFIFDPDRDDIMTVFQKAKELRSGDQIVSLLPRKKDLRKQLDQLATQGFQSHAQMRGAELEIKDFQ